MSYKLDRPRAIADSIARAMLQAAGEMEFEDVPDAGAIAGFLYAELDSDARDLFDADACPRFNGHPKGRHTDQGEWYDCDACQWQLKLEQDLCREVETVFLNDPVVLKSLATAVRRALLAANERMKSEALAGVTS